MIIAFLSILLLIFDKINPMLSFHTVFIKLSQASILIPVFTGFRYFKKLDKSFKLLFYFFCSSILFEIQASVLKYVFHNNMPGLHLYTFCEFCAFTFVFYCHFYNRKLMRTLVCFNAIIYLIVALMDALYINGIWCPNNFSRTYSSVSLVVLALLFFYFQFRDEEHQYGWKNPMFWVSTGVLIYFALNIFYFMLNNYLIAHDFDLAHNSMRVHAAINIIGNVLYARSFLCFKKLTKI